MNFIKATDTFCTIENNVSAPILRKGFSLENVPEKAVLRICVTGFYHLYINGKKITKGELAPYINNPDHLLYCDEYDVSSLLNTKKNAIAVILGNGFANQDTDSWDFDDSNWQNITSFFAICQRVDRFIDTLRTVKKCFYSPNLLWEQKKSFRMEKLNLQGLPEGVRWYVEW